MGFLGSIKRFFMSAFRNLWSVLRTVISGALERFLADMFDFAMEVIRDLANTEMSNDEKRKEAFNRIKNKAIGKGIDYKDNWVSILLEICVAKLKLKF